MPLREGLDQTYFGNNSGAGNSFHGSCIFPYTSDSVPDSVYRLALARKSLVEVRGADGDHVGGLYLRENSCLGQELQCNVAAFPFYPNPRINLVVNPGTHFLFVERNAQYSLISNVLPAESPTGNDSCATATPVEGVGGYFQGDSTGFADREQPSCEPAHDGGAPDSLFRLQLAGRSAVTVKVTSAFGSTLALRTSTCDGGTELRCVSGRSLNQSLDAGSYLLVLSGRAVVTQLSDGGTETSPASGPYTLQVEIRDGG